MTTTTLKPETSDHPQTVPGPRTRRLSLAVATFGVAVGIASAVLMWNAVTDDRSPAPGSDRTERSEVPSLLESPAEFEKAVADAASEAERDSIMHNGDAFDRAVAEATK